MELNPGSSDGRWGYLGWPSGPSAGPWPEEDRGSEAERGVATGARVREGGGETLCCWL